MTISFPTMFFDFIYLRSVREPLEVIISYDLLFHCFNVRFLLPVITPGPGKFFPQISPEIFYLYTTLHAYYEYCNLLTFQLG